MPSAPLKPCSYPGCSALVNVGRCAAHQSERRKQQDAQRGNANERGYDWRWREYRKGFLRLHPLCECDECQGGKLRTLRATVIDHTIPHRGDRELFWDENNHRAMSKPCHDRKTALEDGGFGRR